MHPVASQVEIPLDELETKLIQLAEPRFTGNLEASLRLLPTAAHEVQWVFETERHVPDPATVTEKVEQENVHVTNARVATVRRWLAEIRGQLLVQLPKHKLKASFLRGELRAMKIVEVE